MKIIIAGILVILNFFIPLSLLDARVTPEDIVNSKKESYQSKVHNYSLENQTKLDELAKKIDQVNKKRTDYLAEIMAIQAAILDEYEKRQEQDKEGIKKARYWVTYAHEAVAYQAAKIYIFNLSSEVNIKKDALAAINLFQGELNSTRSKVIYSQKVLQEVVK